MCQATTVYDCGHQKVQDVQCTRSRKKGGLGNLLKYALFEEPCRYNTQKRRSRLCNACESNYRGVKDYKKTKRVEERREHRDGHSRSSSRPHGHREHRRREHHDSHDSSSSSSRLPPKESHSYRSSRSSRHRQGKASHEEKRGRSRSARPVESMLTIDESAPLPPRRINEDFSDDIADASRISMSEVGVPDDRSSINDFRDFIQAAERTEAERNRVRGNPTERKSRFVEHISPISPRSAQKFTNIPPRPTERKSRFVEDVSPISPRTAQNFTNIPPQPVSPLVPEEPFLPSSVYQPARADWKPRPELEQPKASQYQGWRPASSVYSQASVPLIRVPEPPRRSSKRPQGSISSMYTGAQDDRISWVTQYASSCSLVAGGAKQETPPTSQNTTPSKARGPAQVSASTNTINEITGELTRMAREEETEEMRGTDDAFTVGPRPPRSRVGIAAQPLDPNCQLGKPKSSPRLGPRDSLEGVSVISEEDLHPEPERKTRGKVKPPMMHFTTYRDPNSKRKPPKPTPSSTGSQVFMNPRTAPQPPQLFGSFSGFHAAANESLPTRPEHHFPRLNKGFGAHRLAHQSVGNLSTQTRWSDLYAPGPPAINTNIRVTHNGKPVHVVNPDIVQKSWKGANGPSPGKVSQRPSAEKKSSADRVKGFISRLKPQESEASFGCADAKSLDSSRKEQEKRKSKRSAKSSKSSNSKSKNKR